MILFHGSNQTVTRIDLDKCRPFKDFGRGFYLSANLDHARQMAARTARIYGGEPRVSSFEFDEPAGESLALRRFDGPTTEWAQFVLNNRSRSFVDLTDPNSNQDGKYDAVIGPVANDDIALLFRQFEGGLIDLAALARGMEYRELSIQHSFHTPEGVATLSFLEERHG
ncbi:MAG: DUF3990 domain-containing protein [Propionibacteriaceae bacterium]|jgi:hypothetical protein|nr:DUF3990 domain-containing protein [Propionibacteriaceae bacterium]